jgi:cytochrome b561
MSVLALTLVCIAAALRHHFVLREAMRKPMLSFPCRPDLCSCRKVR